MDEQARQIWDAVRDMYDGFLSGDRARIDRHILPEATIWDSEYPALARGRAELDAIRATRPTGPGAPRVVAIDTYQPEISIWGDAAVARHVLAVRFESGATEVVRNTGVWRRTDEGWRLAHNHEDVLPESTGTAYLARLTA